MTVKYDISLNGNSQPTELLQRRVSAHKCSKVPSDRLPSYKDTQLINIFRMITFKTNFTLVKHGLKFKKIQITNITNELIFNKEFFTFVIKGF